jgi:hypothetical protein
MLGNTHLLGSWTTINGSGATFIKSTDAIDLRHCDTTKLGLYVKVHSYALACASPSHLFWYESSLYPDGPFTIPGGTNSIILTGATASATYVYNLSANYMPYVRLCSVNVSATPSTYLTAGIFYQDDYTG